MKKKTSYYLILFFLFITAFHSNKVVGQESVIFEKLNFENNDIQSIVYSISDDIDGNLWFATEEGIIRYNSKETYLYDSNKGLPKSISNRVYSVLRDKNNSIWIGSTNGIAKYNNEKDVFDSIPNEGKKIDRTNALVFDNKNTIWIASDNGLWLCDQNKKLKNIVPNIRVFNLFAYQGAIYYTSTLGIFKLTYNNGNIVNKPLNGKITDASVLKIINSKIIVGTKIGKLYKSDLSNVSFNEFQISQKLSGLRIRDIECKDNQYYFATDGVGIFVTDANFKLKKHHFFDNDKQNNLTSNGVYDIFFTNDITWIATYGGGVNYYSRNKQLFTIIKHQINNSNSLANNTVRSILEIKNEIWFGTKNGISIFNVSSDNWTHLFNGKDEIILSLAYLNDYVFAASYNNGLYKINKSNRQIQNIYNPKLHPKGVQNIFKVFIDAKENIWLGGIEGNLTVIQNDNTIIHYPINDVRDINWYQNKILAVGRNGVHLIDHKQKKYFKFKIFDTERLKYNFNTINTVVVDNNNIILGTNGSGVLFYDGAKKSVFKIDKSNDLSSNVVQGVIKYDANSYWISTTKGLSNLMISPTDTIIKNFNKTDGISSNEFNYSAFLKLKNGSVAFGGVEGVTIFDPKLIKPRKILPKVVFEDFLIDNDVVKDTDILPKHINQVQEIDLYYKQNSFGFKFVGVLQGYSSKVKYSYMLEGFDQNWSEPSSKNFANYTNLNSGQYIFKVKATNEQGDFGPVKTVIINISSPWYASFLAYLIYIILLVAAIYALINIVKIFEIKRNKEEQIDFFNNITHEIKTPLAILLSTIEEANTEENLRVKSSIERINNLINQMLNFQKFSIDSSDVQISKIKLNDFIFNLMQDFKPLLNEKKLKITFENNFQNEIFYFNEEYLTKILFNLISNAIKYSHENNEIIIVLNTLEKGRLGIKVKDFGIGIPKSAQKNILTKFFRAKNVANNQFSGSGLGLMIVKQIVDKTEGKIAFKSTENGTTFKISLFNFEKKYNESAIIKVESTDFEVTEEIQKFSDKKILLVEDNDELRSYLVRTLENYFLVYEAKNGQEGFDLASKIFPDLILTDFMMPVLDGLQFSKKILEDINLNHIPIFMLTALHNTIHKKESTEIGITEYIEKPISIAFLLAKITSTFLWQEKLREHFIHQNDISIAGKNKNENENEFLIKLENIILEKIKDESFSLQDICNVVGMSRTSLYMKLKNLIDLSPQDFIIHTKLKYAKKLLIEGNSNIKEIAYSSGFSNPKYFSTSFKKAFGVSPSEYIKNLNQ
ncbi:helix-turn-helix domain-containing protein [Flavobacterium sp. LMO8]|uniref:ATP-binding protein n=1 Tax=Flavobacterium sp. LMO8 TaxID=2654244 RepID=UPI001290DBB9|nr:ATP-binding protein [Flavobacterium sp. LMO8]MQP25653.1 helix-turn-helix domain-containing protein [Flavobacterium sp. LMO8]